MKYKKIGALSNIGLILGVTMVILGFIEEKTKCKDSESFIYLLSLCEINKRRMIKEITDKL